MLVWPCVGRFGAVAPPHRNACFAGQDQSATSRAAAYFRCVLFPRDQAGRRRRTASSTFSLADKLAGIYSQGWCQGESAGRPFAEGFGCSQSRSSLPRRAFAAASLLGRTRSLRPPGRSISAFRGSIALSPLFLPPLIPSQLFPRPRTVSLLSTPACCLLRHAAEHNQPRQAGTPRARAPRSHRRAEWRRPRTSRGRQRRLAHRAER